MSSMVWIAAAMLMGAVTDQWQVTRGESASETALASPGALLTAEATTPIAPPAQVTLRLAMPDKAAAMVRLDAGGDEPTLFVHLTRQAGNQLGLRVAGDGQPITTDVRTSRVWNRIDRTGTATFGWRFKSVSNLWDDRDRQEIGASYATLTPFDDKWFVLRLVATDTTRQVWLDDRLIAEKRKGVTGSMTLSVELRNGAAVHELTTQPVQPMPGFVAVPLDDYAGDGRPRAAGESATFDGVPMQPTAGDGLDLGQSLYRYRLTFGTGPDAPYVNGRRAVPDPLTIDPQLYALRVPYRDYQYVHLLVWLDDDAHSVPEGVVRFYRDQAGHFAATAFEVTDAAIAAGRVKKLDATAPNGKPLCLVRVPVDTDGMFGLRDMADQFLDLEISKPVALSRSYPDPIYYNRHPAGLPSSVHVVGVTLEEASFGYDVEPEKYGYVFDAGEPPRLKFQLRNHAGKPVPATIAVESVSYDGTQTARAEQNVTIAPDGQEVTLALPGVTRLGWHELRISVEADGAKRGHTSSLVLLPPDTRTYGDAANETRFGAWVLWGHHTAFTTDVKANESVLASLRRIGLRLIDLHSAFIDPAVARKLDFQPGGPHTIVSIYHRLNIDDPEQVKKMLEDELKQARAASEHYPRVSYYYGGEWTYDHVFAYQPSPRYSGGEPHVFSEAASKNIARQAFIFEKIGRMLRKELPEVRLVLQWGAPLLTVGFMEYGFPKDLVDHYGMDAPMFELTPEAVNMTGGVNQLWALRQEQRRLGWPELTINWVEGPFFPTNEGALTERQQEEHQVRYWLNALCYGVERFEAGVVPHDAGNYYGVEHYGAGVFNRPPLLNPKPAVAAINTATTMLCGADLVEKLDTGVPTTYALGFRHAATGQMRYALWRVTGEVDATLTVRGSSATVTDAMGNPTSLPITDGKITLTISPSVVWLTGVEKIEGFAFRTPRYDEQPGEHVRPLAGFDAGAWNYDGSPIQRYATNHVGVARVTDDQLAATFGDDSPHGPAAVVTLPEQPLDDRPIASRYGSLVPAKPIEIPGDASALGLWIDGNSSWGRVVFQVRDAKGELWTSVGTPNDWNCDDTHTLSFVKHEGWRYMRFPLPGNHPWDAAHEAETTWWGYESGDGIVDLPLRLERIIVEARNASHVLGEMKLIQQRSYRLAGLVAEYGSAADQTEAAVALANLRMPPPQWEGPTHNPSAQLREAGVGQSPAIDRFEEPHHWNDGRRMIIRFTQTEGMKYRLYLSRYPDGRGAEPLPGFVTDNQLVTGLRPGIEMYLFLVAQDDKGTQAKPSPVVRLVTEDKFAEK